MQDAIRTGPTHRGFAGYPVGRVPPRGIPGFSQHSPLLRSLFLFGPFSVPLLLLKLLGSLRALLFGLVKSGSGVPPLVPASLSFHSPENPAHVDPAFGVRPRSLADGHRAHSASRRFDFRRPASLPSLASVTPLSAASRRHASRITFHVSRITWPLQFVWQSRQIPARPANGKCLSISMLHHASCGSRQVLWTQFPWPCHTQLTGAQYVTNAVTSLEFVRFVPATSRTPRPLRPPRQTQTLGPQHKTHAGTLSDFVPNTGRMGGQTPPFALRRRACMLGVIGSMHFGIGAVPRAVRLTQSCGLREGAVEWSRR
jgi:hypothetical protein